MSQRLPEITTYFEITADFYFDPHVIGSRLPISPNRIERQGDPRPHPRPRVKYSSWSVECKNRTIQSIDEGIQEVLEIVWPHRTAIKQVLTEMSLSAYFVSYVRIYELGVVYELTIATMTRMIELGASWGMDLYDYSD